MRGRERQSKTSTPLCVYASLCVLCEHRGEPLCPPTYITHLRQTVHVIEMQKAVVVRLLRAKRVEEN